MAAKPAIGTMIRKARERQLMSQEELAAKLRVSRSAVNSWERDRSYPRNRIGALEEVLGISFDDDSAQPEPETEWERWERETLSNPDIPPELARAIVQDARRAARAGGPGAAGSSSAPSPASSEGRTAGRHRAGG